MGLIIKTSSDSSVVEVKACNFSFQCSLVSVNVVRVQIIVQYASKFNNLYKHCSISERGSLPVKAEYDLGSGEQSWCARVCSTF